MNHQYVAAPDAVAQETCALSTPHGFEGIGAISTQPDFRPITRRALMAAVNTVGRDLGLRAASIVVLDALLSCLACKNSETGRDMAISPTTLLTVFASNETLCFRAKGITDRQLRRHLERLEAVGLIVRRDSANRKRFPIYRAGKVVAAYGIDLSPLLVRSEELLHLAEKRREEALELRGLKARIQTLRRQCLELDLAEEARAFVEGTRTLMRRASATIVQARSIIQELTRLLMPPEVSAPMQQETEVEATGNALPHGDGTQATPVPTSANDGQNVRHKEPTNSNTKKYSEPSQAELWPQLRALAAFYPDPPTSERGAQRVLYEFGKMLGVQHNTLTAALTSLGLRQTLTLQDRMARRLCDIANPDAYLTRAVRDARQGKVGHGQLSWAG
ncbi:MAG: helix-turn-helix domain-containing protein [Marinovum algicola]|uniref:helix-turn-helix domain-containing protein n=1 Tax=Marinovum TaxID=367771 RepID=UPI00094481C9|nr:helix-turn-helix domain-containing protein [Marinovum algicola]